MSFTQIVSAAGVTQRWAVTDAQTIGNDHGLWTNGLGADENEKRHSFNAGSMLTEYADGTAYLTATATNHLGRTATIDMTFSGYQTDADYVGPKKFGGGTIDTSDWTYYLGMVMLGQGPVLQIGTGANDKNLAFGASTWLDVFSDQARQNKLFRNKLWDLNMNHTAVPVPAAVWLLGSALLGFVGMRKKAKQA